MSELNVGTLSTTEGVKLPVFTSLNRPANPSNGMLIFNSTINNVETWNGTSWTNYTSASSIDAVGGSSVYDQDGMRIHVFTGDNTFTVNSAAPGSTIELLVVAGGAGGGSDMGGGGGAGGLIYNPSYQISTGSYTVIIGAGGNGYNDYGNAPRRGDSGLDSTFGSVVAKGGGGGSSGHYYCPGEWAGITGPQAADGGSGGGGSASYRCYNPEHARGGRPPGLGITGQGTRGGYGSYCQSNYYAGGGGGSGGNGEVDKLCGVRPGIGGPGTLLGITGTNLFWAAGGGGGAYTGAGAGAGGLGGGGGGGRYDTGGGGSAPGGTGGLNPGGNGGTAPSSSGGDGGLNTGSGGGGGSHSSGKGGNGGSGIVVVRYLI